MPWQMARRAERLNPSSIRDILKLTERPGIVSLAGDLPSCDMLPVAVMQEATARVLRDSPRQALQYAASEGCADGPLPQALEAARGARRPLCDLQPNYQNPTGRGMSAARRLALVARAQQLGLPIVEDNPYGDLWFDAPPPQPLRAPPPCIWARFPRCWRRACAWVTSWRQMCCIPSCCRPSRPPTCTRPASTSARCTRSPRTASCEHVPTIRARYRAQRDAMQLAPQQHLPPGCHWQAPHGGMFFWVELTAHIDATALLPRAVEAGVAYVPGSTFFPHGGHANTLRLSFVTVPRETIHTAVAALARVLAAA